MEPTPDATETPAPTTEGGGHADGPTRAVTPAAATTGTGAFDAVPVHRPAPSAAPVSGRGIAVGFGMALLAAIVVLQAITLASVSGQRDEVSALRQEIQDVGGSVGSLDADLAALGDRVEALGEAPSSSVAEPGPVAATGVDGGLPPYQGPEVQDTSLGSTVAAITGTEWYSGSELSVAPGDGKARVYLVWAHWCPFCQQDLDTLQTWWPENLDRFPNTELISVSTFQDDTRSNPLDAYLEAEQFDFPVILDDAQATMAIRLGNGGSIPYWVFTDGNGQVVGRHAGLLEQDQIDNVFTQLEDLAAGA